MEMYDINEDIIHDIFTGKFEFPSGFHKEQERAVLRDHEYPEPFYFYLSLAVIVIYIILYALLMKWLNASKLIKLFPIGILSLISFYFIFSYSDNYILFLATFEHYFYRLFDEIRGVTL